MDFDRMLHGQNHGQGGRYTIQKGDFVSYRHNGEIFEGQVIDVTKFYSEEAILEKVNMREFLITFYSRGMWHTVNENRCKFVARNKRSYKFQDYSAQGDFFGAVQK